MEQASRIAAGPRRALQPILGGVIFLAVFATYRPALNNDFVDWDDPLNFLKNQNYRGLGAEQLRWMFTTFHTGHYQPVAWLSLGWDYVWGRALFGDGMDPRSYHFTNVLLHALNAVLVFLLARRLLEVAAAERIVTGSPAPRGGPRGNRRRAEAPSSQGPATRTRPDAGRAAAQGAGSMPSPPATLPVLLAAALAACWFALHPLRVESVAWVTDRQDVLSGTFCLLTFWLYLCGSRSAGSGRVRWMIAAWATFSLSLLSRASGVTLPIVLLLLDWYPLRRIGTRAPPGWPGLGSVLLEKIPFILLAGAAAAIAPLAKQSTASVLELARHGLEARLAQACYGLVFYLWKLVLPVGLSPIYELRLPIRLATPHYLVPMGLLAVAAIGWVQLLVRRRLPAVVVAAAGYVILLLPVLGLVQSGNQEAADRYSYLPSLCVTLLAAGGLVRLWSSRAVTRWVLATVGGVSVATVIILAVLTSRQCGVWRSTATLWRHAAAVSPNSSIAQNGCGWVLLEEQRYDEALARFRRAVELQPANVQAHNNIWITLRRQGRIDELPQAYRDSIRVYPNLAEAHLNLGLVLQQQGNTTAAEASFNEALRRRPNYSLAHANLALLLAKRGETTEALQHYQQAIRADERNLFARCCLARLLYQQGRAAEAVEQVRAALRVDPNHETARRLLVEWTGGPQP